MWRIGQLARMTGVSDRTLRHYDQIDLLRPAAVDRVTGYRWYGVAELTRLERIRGLRHLGLSLRQISDLIDAPDGHLRQALTDTVAVLRRDIATMSAIVAAAEDRLAAESSILPQPASVGPRRLRVRYQQVAHPSELAALCSAALCSAALCSAAPTTLVTWLDGHPIGGFVAAVGTDGGPDTLTLPAHRVVRAIVPPSTGVVRAGNDLFAWLRRRDLAISGPTVEEHVVDGDGASATILELVVHHPIPEKIAA